MIIDWYDIIANSLVRLVNGVIIFIPKLLGALIVFIIGWLIAVAIGKVITEILKGIKFNSLFEKGSLKGALEKAEIKTDASGFIGAVCKWLLMIVFLSIAVEILGFSQLTYFLTNKVLVFLPNVVVAAFIFVVAAIIADILEKVVRTVVEGTRSGYGQIAGAIVKWSIWVFAIFAILYQLSIAPQLIQTLLTGVIALIVIAGGLAFGLGGKDIAAEILRDIKKRLQG